MLSKRNHYETFFEFTNLNILNSKQNKLCSDVIISLNFIAGNPVNFQLIINQSAVENIQPMSQSDQSKLLSFLEIIKAHENFNDLSNIMNPLLELSGAEVLAVYDISSGNIEPYMGAAESNGLEFSFDSIPPLSNLHYQIKENQNEYSFVNQDDIRMAIENFNEAPNEYVLIKEISEALFLIRFIYKEETKVEKIPRYIEDTNFGLDMISKIASGNIEINKSVESLPDIKFTIGFLDSLNIGALVTNEVGDVAGYNPNFISLFKNQELHGNLSTVIDILKNENDIQLIEQIEEYLTTPLDENHPDDLLVDIKCPSGEKRRLTVIKFSVDPKDHSSCFVFLPINSQISLDDDNPIELKPLSDFSESIKELLMSVKSLSDNISINQNNQPDKSVTNKITSLRTHTISLKEAVDRINKMVKLKKSTDKLLLTDLNIITNRAINTVQSDYPSVKLETKINTLPNIKTSPDIINKVFETIIANSFEHCHDKNLSIEISAELKDKFHLITIKDNGKGLPRKSSNQLFVQAQSDSSNSFRPYNNMSICKKLMQELGGDITLVSTNKNGTLIEVKLLTGVEL